MCALCQLPTSHEFERQVIYSYIDPTSGIIVQSFIPALLAFLSGILGSLLLFFRNVIKKFFRRKLIFILLLTILIVVLSYIMVKQVSKPKINTKARVVILAFDGLDPNILNEGMEKHLLPNFQKLRDNGYYSSLTTTVPPQSPVAWASFTTGVSPSGHHIYDFITRDPHTYKLDLTFSKKDQWQAKPFWDVLGKYNIPATILFLPDTYPPASNLSGKMISGMGTPDIIGTQGTSTLITSKDYSDKKNWRGKIINISNTDDIKTYLEGPKYQLFAETKTSQIPIEIKRDSVNRTITMVVQNQTIKLKEKEFSDWIKVEFPIDFFTKYNGMAKMYAKEVNPNLEIYVSPFNYDPEKPIHPISSPGDYTQKLAREYGMFPTLGLPEDTWALDQQVFDEDAFLAASQQILSERKKIIFGELDKFNYGLFFGYFGMTDSIQHMFWRYLDDPKSKYQSVIMNTYKEADTIVGETIRRLRPEDTLIILSDHGFNAFNYEMNLNSWLRDNGYLFLKDNKQEGAELLSDIDWSRTKAYAIGYNGIYFNLKGREKSGIVDESQIEQLTNDLTEKLMKIKNPLTKNLVIKRVYSRNELQIKKTDFNSPDLFIGFFKDIRSSWESAVGGVEKDSIKKRESKWSGDHLFDPSEVPGVLLINRKFEYASPKITDIMPTVFRQFGIPFFDSLDGQDLLNNAQDRNAFENVDIKEKIDSLGY